MDRGEYTTLVAALRQVPDPRQRRGQRYPWWVLLTLIAAAVVSGQQHGRAIGQWVREHAAELADVLEAANGRVPSEATLRRTLQTVDVGALDAQVLGAGTPAVATSAALVGMALDGKEVRGVRAHGQILHLLSLAEHTGIVRAQLAVSDKGSEVGAAPALLADRDLRGIVITVDALLTQRRLAEQIVRQGGDYLMVVKDNQPELEEAITTLFTATPWLVHDWGQEVWRHTTTEKGHGRLEERTLIASTTLNDYLDWPGLGQVLCRSRRWVEVATGEVHEQQRYAVTSLTPQRAGPARLARLWRGHWSIENQVHHVRDVSFAEDATRAYRGNTAHALASLHNAAVNLCRAAGRQRIADALRHYAAHPRRALALIGATA
jgi:predicted transposase YbfD/YdcC